MRVDEADLGGGDAGVLELHGRALLAAEDDDILAFDAYGAGSSLDGLAGVFDLEDVAVGTGEEGVSLGLRREGGGGGKGT